MIYFISDGEYVKVGTTADVRRLERRMPALQIGNARKLSVLATVRGGHELEGKLHRCLPARGNGEWFELSPVLADLLEGIENSDSPDEFVESFVEEALAKHAAWLGRFKPHWPEIDRQFRAKVRLLYRTMTLIYGREKVAEVTGVTPNMIRMVVSGKSLPGPLPWAKFQASFFPTDDLADVQRDLSSLIVEIERLAA